MRKVKGTYEKRTLEAVDDYSEELERVIQNPELLPEETINYGRKDDTFTSDNTVYHSPHSHHHSSSHRHSSRSQVVSVNAEHSNYSSHHRSMGSGRLASHHRTRHHHNFDGSTATQNATTVTSEGTKFQENVKNSKVSEAVLQLETETSLGSHPTQSDSFNRLVDTASDKSFHQDVEKDSGSFDIDLGEDEDIFTDVNLPAETDDQNQNIYAVDTGIIDSEEMMPETTDTDPASSISRSRRIASLSSGTESSKREAESAIESSRVRKSQRKNKHHRHKKKIGFLGVIFRILIGFFVIGIFATVFFFYLRTHGENSMKKPVEEVQIVIPRTDIDIPEIEEVEDDGKTITYKGEKYRYNDNVSTILFMGTDRTITQQETTEAIIGINGQADTIILCVIDNTNHKISFINVNRDTMAPVSEYTPDGDYAGDKVMQICLAYSYGADNIQSSERMVEAVSKYLYGVPINAYCRLSFDAIPSLNDAIGGVTVTVLEDMTSVFPEWIEGTTITLHGKEADEYVRWRNKDTVHTNELRMARQKQYLKAFMRQTIDEVRADLTLPLTLYSIATSYMTTDITTSQVTYLSSKVLEYGIGEDAILSVPGESIDGEEHVEFYTDDKGLYEIILNTFYNKV